MRSGSLVMCVPRRLLLHGRLVQGGLPPLGGVHHLHVARHEIGTGAFEGLHEQLVGVLGYDVVAVDEREEFSLRMSGSNADITGMPRSHRLLAQELEPGVAAGEVGGYGRRGVGRAVIDHDHFERRERLPGYRFQTFLEVYLNILEGHDNTQAGHTCHSESSSIDTLLTACRKVPGHTARPAPESGHAPLPEHSTRPTAADRTLIRP